MRRECGGHTNEEIEQVVALLRTELERATEELEAIYPGEDASRLDEIWTACWELLHEVAGVGSSRIAVGLCAEHVLKVDLGSGRQNENEWAVWQAAQGELRGWLCPILDQGQSGGSGWLLVARTQKVAKLEESTMAMVERMHGLDDLEGYSEAMGGIDWMVGNFGELEGRQVIIDYGDCDPQAVCLEPAPPVLQ